MRLYIYISKEVNLQDTFMFSHIPNLIVPLNLSKILNTTKQKLSPIKQISFDYIKSKPQERRVKITMKHNLFQ